MNTRSLLQDVAFAFRQLQKAPTFAIVAILTIAIGIGGTTSIFAVVEAVLLQPLPYRDADQLYALTSDDKPHSLTGMPLSWTKFERIQSGTRTVEALAACYPTSVALKTSAYPEQLQAMRATSGIFDLFGTVPALGRGFLPEEDVPGGSPVAIISHRVWETRFGRDPQIIGKPVALDGRSVTVVGVLPAEFHYPFQQPEPDVWLPGVEDNPLLGPTRVHSGAGYIQVFARAKSGVPASILQEDIKAVDASYKQDNPGFVDSQLELTVTPLKESLVGPVKTSLLALLAAVVTVLLIGCANLTSLLLAKANVRRKELAVRAAMGATRARLFRQLLTEAVVVSTLGGLLGVLLSFGAKWLVRLLPVGTLPRTEEVGLNTSLLLFAAAVTVGSGLLVGLLPALRASQLNVNDTLKDSSRGTSSGRHAGRARAVIVASEVAMAVVLLSVAALLIRSFSNLVTVNPGFDSQHVLTMTVNLPAARYTAEKEQRLIQQLIPTVEAIPKVQSAAAVSSLPVIGVSRFVFLCRQGVVCNGIGKDPLISMRFITPNYFRTMGISLLSGRSLNDHDNESGQPVALINESAARLYFGGQDPIGQWVANSRDMKRLMVVGVVRDTKFLGLNAATREEMYLPVAQTDTVFPALSLVVRADSAQRPLVAAIQQKLSDLDADIPLADISTMDEVIAASIAQPRWTTRLCTIFALLALLLTVLGVYGVLDYAVSQQTQEIGVRIALGASRGKIVSEVLGQGTRIIAFGIGIGIVVSLMGTRILEKVLFGVPSRDPRSLVLTSIVVVIVSLIACYFPALRASRVSPTIALQQ